MKLEKKEAKIIFLLILTALVFRWGLIRGNYFHFYFDQARDANVSRSIFEKRDFKIQGPSASGTNDILYHGVLYYYLIGPVYSLTSGSPMAVSLFLSLINSLAIVPIFLVAKTVFKNSWIGYLAGLLFAFSLDAAEMGSCLSNPSLATLTIPWLYWLSYKVFIDKEDKYLSWVALALGLTNQAAIWTAYLIMPLLLLYIYRAIKDKQVIVFKLKNLVISSGVYLLTIASMLLTQLKLYQARIFTVEAAREQLMNNVERAAALTEVMHQYMGKIGYALLPNLPETSWIIWAIVLVSFLVMNKSKKVSLFLLIWFLGPWFLAFRNFYYMLVGILPAIYLMMAWVIWKIGKKSLAKGLMGGFLVIFIGINIWGIKESRKREYTHVVNIQKGAYLFQQLKLIDKSYQKADGEEFSISSLTSPYKYNTTWSYLYSWYGQNKYGYKPVWFGPDQTGIPAGELLERVGKPKEKHFSIYEPDPGWIYIFIPEFDKEQASWAGPVLEAYQFGNLKLEVR